MFLILAWSVLYLVQEIQVGGGGLKTMPICRGRCMDFFLVSVAIFILHFVKTKFKKVFIMIMIIFIWKHHYYNIGLAYR